ncbi:MAG TPA: shikimate dehydrogenase [Roseiarcus sp.]|nr:shikimate dehydrogenase [Roseiarcus sp.]
MTALEPATAPTLYFFGVTTTKSSIMKVFPAWAKQLGLNGAVIQGVDFPLHAPPESYRAAVKFLKDDPRSLGALVTTHKIDLYRACRDLFDVVDPHALLMGETSCLSKQSGKLICHAKDPISSGLAIDGFLPERHFERTGAEMFAIGAGGSTIAMTWHLTQKARGAARPSRIVVSDRDRARLDEIARVHRKLASGVPVRYVLAADRRDNDCVLASLRPGSLIVNATGLGKDAPGSPLTDAALFPERAIAWDLNYRGDLVFLRQARAEAPARALQVEDGWTYFLHGWLQVIAEIFHIDIPASGSDFEALSEIAEVARRA